MNSAYNDMFLQQRCLDFLKETVKSKRLPKDLKLIQTTIDKILKKGYNLSRWRNFLSAQI